MSSPLPKESEEKKKRKGGSKKKSKSSRGSRGTSKGSRGARPKKERPDVPARPESANLQPPSSPTSTRSLSAGRGSKSPATNIRELRKEAASLTSKQERKANQALAKIASARLAEGGGEDDGLLQVKGKESNWVNGMGWEMWF